VLASRGLRETATGMERIGDSALRARLWSRARAIGIRAALATLVVTALALALPGRD
jgi:hypothetical protein